MESKAKKPSLSYVLFLYREQLSQGKVEPIRFYRTKMSLTDRLIKKTARNLDKCSIDDMIAVNRQICFKKKLKHKLKETKQKMEAKEENVKSE